MAYTDEDIQRAVRAGAISRNEADRLIGFLAAPEPQAGRPAVEIIAKSSSDC